MIGSLLARNLRHHLRLLVALCLSLALLELLLVSIATQLDTGPGIAALIEQVLPPVFRDVVTSQLGLVSFAGMVGFGFEHPAILMAALAFVFLVASIPAAERESGLLDLVLARPLPRSRYLAAVLIVLVLGAVLLPLSLLLGCAVGLSLVEAENEIHWTRYLYSSGTLTTLLLGIGGYTLLLACGARRRGSAIVQAVGLTLVLFWIDVLSGLWRPLQAIAWLSPFTYCQPIQAAVNSHLPASHPVVLLTLFILTSAAAFLRFHRQDL